MHHRKAVTALPRTLGGLPAMLGTGPQVFLAWCVLLTGCYSILLAGALASFPLGGSGDFLVVYSAAKILRDGNGERLYDLALQTEVQQGLVRHSGFTLARGPLPYIHPPFFAAIFVPFTYLSLKAAFYLWDATSLAVLLICVGALSRCFMAGLRSNYLVTSLVVLAYYPVFETLRKGQSSFILLAAITLTYWGLRQGRHVTAGLGLASALMKPQIACIFAAMLLYKRRWRPLLVFAISASVLLLVSWCLVGANGLQSYIGVMREVFKWDGLHHVYPETMPNLRGSVYRILRLLGADEQGQPPAEAIVLSFLVSLAVLALILRTWSLDRNPHALDLWYAQAILGSVIVSPYIYWHDLTLLTLAGFLIYSYSHSAGPKGAACIILAVGHTCAMPLSLILSGISVSAQILVIFILGAMLYVHRQCRKGLPIIVATHHE